MYVFQRSHWILGENVMEKAKRVWGGLLEHCFSNLKYTGISGDLVKMQILILQVQGGT